MLRRGLRCWNYPPRAGSSAAVASVGCGRYLLGLTVVAQRDLLDLAEIDVFPDRFAVGVLERHLDVLFAGGGLTEFEMARFAVLEHSIAEAVVAPLRPARR